MSSRALLDARITQLETGTEPPLAAAGRAMIGGTAAAVVLLVGGVAWSALIVAHYMPMCLPWSRGQRRPAGAAPCPGRGAVAPQ